MRHVASVALVFALTWAVGAVGAVLALGLTWAVTGTVVAEERHDADEQAELARALAGTQVSLCPEPRDEPA